MTSFPTNFSASEVEPILRRINPKLAGQIRSLFICLSDDQFLKVIGKFKSGSAAKGPAGGSVSAAATNNQSSQSTQPDSESTESSDEEDQVEVSAPVAPPPRTQAPKPTPSSSRSGRGPKRGASTERGSSAKK